MTLVGAATGAVGGGTQGAASGANQAFEGVTNNYLTHQQVEQKNQELAEAKTEEERQAVEEKWETVSDQQDLFALQAITNAKNCVGMEECAFAQAQLEAIQQEINRDARIGGETPGISAWWPQAGAALREVEQRYSSAECDASTACTAARIAGTLAAGAVVGATAITGARALATFCLTQPAVCNSVGINIAEIAAGDALPVGLGVAATATVAKNADKIADATAKTAKLANYEHIVSQVPGKIITTADALNPGILGNSVNSLAATFAGGKYATIELSQDVVLYRAWAPGQSRELGSFWSLEKPAGSLQARIDAALIPEWGNIPGTVLYSQATEYIAITHQSVI
jgi:hypothetical protein